MSDANNTVEAADALSHVPILRSLEAKVDPRHTALIVIDVQNDFCAPGGMMDKEGLDLSLAQAMGDRMPALIDAARKAGSTVVFVRNVYSSSGNSYLSDVWLEQATRRRGESYTKRDVCAADSWEGDFYGDIAPLPGEAIITKHRYSAFHNTDLQTVLRANGIRTVVLAGVATNVCVETTAREAFIRDFYVVFLDDGTATYAEADHAATLSIIDRNFGQVATIAEVVDVWGSGAGAPVAEPELARAR